MVVLLITPPPALVKANLPSASIVNLSVPAVSTLIVSSSEDSST